MEPANALLREEEQMAIRAIYGDQALVEEGAHSPSSFILTVPLESGGRRHTATVHLHFPDTYPAASPPVYELTSQYVGASRVTDKLRQQVDEAFSEAWSPGEVVVFTWAEILREKFDQFLRDESGNDRSEGDVVAARDAELDEEGRKGVSLYEDPSEGPTTETHLEAGDTKISTPCPPIVFGDPLVDRKSTFLASLARVSSFEEVRAVRSALLANNRIARAAHPAICAYRIRMPNGTMLQDSDDDGEKAAGGRLLHLMQVLDVEGVVIFCTRWFGGILLGADRFKHINNAARAILEQEGFIGKSADAEGKNTKLKKRSKR